MFRYVQLPVYSPQIILPIGDHITISCSTGFFGIKCQPLYCLSVGSCGQSTYLSCALNGIPGKWLFFLIDARLCVFVTERQWFSNQYQYFLLHFNKSIKFLTGRWGFKVAVTYSFIPSIFEQLPITCLELVAKNNNKWCWPEDTHYQVKVDDG